MPEEVRVFFKNHYLLEGLGCLEGHLYSSVFWILVLPKREQEAAKKYPSLLFPFIPFCSLLAHYYVAFGNKGFGKNMYAFVCFCYHLLLYVYIYYLRCL